MLRASGLARTTCTALRPSASPPFASDAPDATGTRRVWPREGNVLRGGNRRRGRARTAGHEGSKAAEATPVALASANAPHLGRRRGRSLRLPLLPAALLVLRDAEHACRRAHRGGGAACDEDPLGATARGLDEPRGHAARSEADRLRPSGRAPVHRQGNPGVAEGAA